MNDGNVGTHGPCVRNKNESTHATCTLVGTHASCVRNKNEY